ncbi:MAG: PilZ domain-containing protein [Gammaproteobacteria bacterium]|nr:MAG: PilZ domain-containing protein [Gammaproteobacteria bacterium]
MRHYIRHPSGIPIDYRIDDVAVGDRDHLRNISHGGLCFWSKIALPEGAGVQISIPIEDPAFQAHGVVSWCRAAEACYEVGVEFARADDEYKVRMVEQVCHIEEYRREILERDGRSLTSEEAALEWIEKNAADFPD